MESVASQPAIDPIKAPLRRKLLGLRVLLANVAAVFVAYLGMSLIDDQSFREFPKWLRVLIAVPVALQFVVFIYFGLPKSIADLALHFLNEGFLKRLLLGHEQGDERKKLAAEMESSGYLMSIAPILLVGFVFCALVLAGLVFGGFALAVAAVAAIFSGWPAWAIVIVILLVMIYLKK